MIWFFNTHFSHGNNSSRRAEQAKVLHHFISNRARKHRAWNTHVENTGSWSATLDLSFPFSEPLIIAGDFNSSTKGTSLNTAFGVMTQPLVDTVGKLLPAGPYLSKILFNAPWYVDPLRVPALSRWRISNAYATMSSARREHYAPQINDPNSAISLLGQLNAQGSIDWILFNSGLLFQEYKSISHTHDENGEPYRNSDGQEVRLSDIHNLIYAKFELGPDPSETGDGVNIVVPRIFGMSYLPWPLPMSRFYNFDRVDLLNPVP